MAEQTKKVYSLKEAMQWFLSHSEGSIVCVDGAREQECDCYPRAEEFYSKQS